MSHALPRDRLYLDGCGPTPLVRVAFGPDAPSIWCKLEFLNPSGSTKDRIAAYILTKAWRIGEVERDSLVVEASSGSTSIAMSMVCAQLGLRFVAVMPRGVSSERSTIIRSYGGDIVFSPEAEGIRGALDVAERLAVERGAFFPRQFENMDNAAAHRFGTAQEILGQITGGNVDAVVSGVGTGGSLVGLYEGFRDHGSAARPFAARPVGASANSASSSCFQDAECSRFSSRIPGVVDRLSTIYRPEAMDGLVELDVRDTEAIEVARQLIRRGFPVGPSSGLNYVAAARIA